MRVSILEGSLTVEKPLLLDLMASPISAHLVGLFLAGEEVKRTVPRFRCGDTYVGVLGAGLMGSQIAGQLAEKGYAVALRDVASGHSRGSRSGGSIKPKRPRSASESSFPPTCAIG